MLTIPWKSRSRSRGLGAHDPVETALTIPWILHNGGRLKKTTIVALARKLLVALWKYVTARVIIEGAIMISV
jgi:hypothetical protein